MYYYKYKLLLTGGVTSYVAMVQPHPGAVTRPPIALKVAPGCGSGKTCPPLGKIGGTYVGEQPGTQIPDMLLIFTWELIHNTIW